MQSTWTAVYEKRGQEWLAWCAEYPEAGVAGHTLAEARKQLSEVMDLVLKEREQRTNLQGNLSSAVSH